MKLVRPSVGVASWLAGVWLIWPLAGPVLGGQASSGQATAGGAKTTQWHEVPLPPEFAEKAAVPFRGSSSARATPVVSTVVQMAMERPETLWVMTQFGVYYWAGDGFRQPAGERLRTGM